MPSPRRALELRRTSRSGSGASLRPWWRQSPSGGPALPRERRSSALSRSRTAPGHRWATRFGPGGSGARSGACRRALAAADSPRSVPAATEDRLRVARLGDHSRLRRATRLGRRQAGEGPSSGYRGPARRGRDLTTGQTTAPLTNSLADSWTISGQSCGQVQSGLGVARSGLRPRWRR